MKLAAVDMIAREVGARPHSELARQADANGRVKIVTGGMGLLSLPMTEKLVPHGDVEPWQCAGPFVKNDIDLALKLWLDDDPDFAALLASHRWGNVFAIVGLWSKRTAATDSLIRLNGLLVAMLVDEVNEYWRLARALSDGLTAGQRRAKANLAKARDVARQEKTRKGAELRQSLRTAAFDYWCAHSVADQDEVIAFLRKNGFAHRTAKTIARLIAGVHGEAKKKLKSSPGWRTDLYATSQKRNG